MDIGLRSTVVPNAFRLAILFAAFSLIPLVAVADSLTTSASVNRCSVTSTVSSGSTTRTCKGTSPQLSANSVAAANGSISQGTIGAESLLTAVWDGIPTDLVTIGKLSSQSSIAYRFTISSGPSSGMVRSNLTLDGNSAGWGNGAGCLVGVDCVSLILSPGESLLGCTACTMTTLANGAEAYNLSGSGPIKLALQISTPYMGGVADVSYEMKKKQAQGGEMSISDYYSSAEAKLAVRELFRQCELRRLQCARFPNTERKTPGRQFLHLHSRASATIRLNLGC